MRIDRGVALAASVAGACLFFTAPALAEAAMTARDHFAHGVEFIDRGELEAAANEFEKAYALQPHFAVLYNLAQAYESTGRLPEAQEAFEAYLQQGGSKVPNSRRREVQGLISAVKARIGYVEFVVHPLGSDVQIDGRPRGRAPLANPTPLARGEHSIVVTHAGYEPVVRRIRVRAQEASNEEVSLLPVSGSGAAQLGQLRISSPTPDALVFIDGERVGDAAPDPRLVTLGSHRARCERAGYRPFEQDVDVRAAEVAEVSCLLAPLVESREAPMTGLSLSIAHPGAVVFVDGVKASANSRVPSGRHEVVVRLRGFLAWHRTVVTRPGATEAIPVRLEPTAMNALRIERAARSAARRDWAYVVGGFGLGLLGTGSALYLHNNSRYDAWARDRDALERDADLGVPENNLAQRYASASSSAVSIQRQDDAALAVSLVGGGLIVFAIASWLSSE